MARWREHEKRARASSVFRGYEVQEQKSSKSTGKRPDFFAISKRDPHDRIVGEVKYVRELAPQHVAQVRQYKRHPFYAQKGVIFTKRSTVIPEDVREIARESNIKVIRKSARRERKKSFLEKLFDW